ncbi:MAG: hypothetical protein LC664_08435, partial [Flavobacteriales bacterium]|nr:hypothetical protein [Flavobacteriales bacterium]
MDLTRMEDGEVFQCSNFFWGRTLQLAERNGWEPEGTHFIDEQGEEQSDWDGNYDDQNGQVVSEQDAGNLITALEAGLESIKKSPADYDWIDDEIQLLEAFIVWTRLTNNDL